MKKKKRDGKIFVEENEADRTDAKTWKKSFAEMKMKCGTAAGREHCNIWAQVWIGYKLLHLLWSFLRQQSASWEFLNDNTVSWKRRQLQCIIKEGP